MAGRVLLPGTLGGLAWISSFSPGSQFLPWISSFSPGSQFLPSSQLFWTTFLSCLSKDYATSIICFDIRKLGVFFKVPQFLGVLRDFERL